METLGPLRVQFLFQMVPCSTLCITITSCCISYFDTERVCYTDNTCTLNNQLYLSPTELATLWQLIPPKKHAKTSQTLQQTHKPLVINQLKTTRKALAINQF